MTECNRDLKRAMIVLEVIAMGSENRKRSKNILIRVDEAEYAEVMRKADDVNLTVPGYLREIAITAEAPQFGNGYFHSLRTQLEHINRGMVELYGMARVKGIDTAGFGSAKAALEEIAQSIKRLESHK